MFTEVAQSVQDLEPAVDLARQRRVPDAQSQPLEQRNEPYIEAVKEASRCRWLTVFAVGDVENPPGPWIGDGPEYTVTVGAMKGVCSVSESRLSLAAGDSELAVPLN